MRGAPRPQHRFNSRASTSLLFACVPKSRETLHSYRDENPWSCLLDKERTKKTVQLRAGRCLQKHNQTRPFARENTATKQIV